MAYLSFAILFCCVLLVFCAPVENNDEQRAGIGDLVNPIKPFLGENNPSKEGQGGNSNFLKDTKVFLLTAQGMIMPADTITNGFMNFFQNIGSNMGNMFQGITNLIPGSQQ